MSLRLTYTRRAPFTKSFSASRRGELLSRIRTLIKQADPCTGETYKNVVKMTFARGAALEDPSRLFNSSLEGNLMRRR